MIQSLKELSKTLKQLFAIAKSSIKENISTKEIDEIIANEAKIKNVVSSAQLLYDFKGFACISINNTICHGLPGNYKLQKFDLVKVDICITDGKYHIDACRSFIVYENNCFNSQESQVFLRDGFPDTETTNQILLFQFLVNSHNCLNAWIDFANNSLFPLNTFHISKFIYDWGVYHKYGIVQDFCGHGIGKSLHMDPIIYNVPQKTAKGNVQILDKTCFCVEPMFTITCSDNQNIAYTYQDKDLWSINCTDGVLSSHFENTYHYLNGKVHNITDF